MAQELNEEQIRELQAETDSVGVIPKELMDVINAQKAQVEAEDASAEHMPKPKPVQAPAPAAAPAPAQEQLDPALKAAMDERDQRLADAQRYRAASSMLEAGIRSSNPDYKINRDAEDYMEKQAQGPVEKYKLLQAQIAKKKAEAAAVKKEARADESHGLKMTKYQKELDKLSHELEDRDLVRNPESKISKSVQNRVIDIQKKLGQDVDVDLIRKKSAVELKEQFSYLSKDLENHQTNQRHKLDLAAQKDRWKRKDDDAAKKAEIAKEKEEYRRLKDQKKGKEVEDKFHRTKALKKRQEITKDKTYQEAQKTIGAIENIRELANDAKEHGGQSLAMLGPKLAKGIAGEVGVLTELDVTRYIQNPELIRSLEDTVSKLLKGKLTGHTHDNLMRLAEIMEKDARMKQKRLIGNEAKLYSRIMGIPEAQALSYFDPDAPVFDPTAKGEKTLVTKGYNKKTNKTQLIYSDGSKEIVEGKQ